MPANGASVSSQMGTRKKKSSGVYQLQISRCIMKSSHSLSLGCWCGLAISLYTIRRLCDFIVLQKAVNCCNYIYVSGALSSVNAEGIINAGIGDKSTKFRKLLATESLWPPTEYYEPRVRVKGATLIVRGKFAKSKAEQIYDSGVLPIFSRFKISISFNYDSVRQGSAIFIAHVHNGDVDLNLTKISSLNFYNDLTVTPSKNSFYVQYDGSIPADGCWVIETEML